MNWQEYPFFRLIVPLIIGILLSYYKLIPFTISLLYFTISVVILFVLIFLALKRFRIQNIYFQGISVQLVLFLLGIFIEQHHHPYLEEEYFGNYIHNSEAFVVKICEQPQVSDKTIQIKVENLIAIDSNFKIPVKGMANLVLLKDSSSQSLDYGDVLLVENRYREVEKPGNPYQFDYKKYCYNKGVKFQQFINKQHYLIVRKSDGKSFMSKIYLLQHYLLNIINRNIKTEDSRSVAFALILGYRGDISDELQKAYSGAGAIHVLAVSGLHVGIIYMILEKILLLLPFFKTNKAGKTIVLLSVIWLFALITGLPASVARAAVMFTFVIVGKSLNRPTNIYNSISVSAFFLLVYNPFLFFDVGFQLSYIAVFSIVTIQPYFQKIWTPKNKIILYFWSILTVTMAAQIGTMPLTLYYFKQFPVLFIFSNFVVIPASFVAMILGMSLFVFSFIPVIASYLGQLMETTIWLMNKSIVYIESISFSVIREIPFTFLQFVLLSVFLIFLFSFLFRKQKFSLYASISIGFLFSISLLIDKIQTDTCSELIVFSTKKQSLICISNSKNAQYFADSSLLKSLDNVRFQIQSHKIMRRINNFNIKSLLNTSCIKNTEFIKNSEFLFWHNKLLAVVPEYVGNDFMQDSIDYIIVFKNSKSRPEHVCNVYKPRMVILAANMSFYKKVQWKKYLIEKKTTWYDISEKGAFILNNSL